MDMVGHQMTLFNLALFPSRQIMKNFAHVLLDLPKQHLFAVFWREHHMVFAFPCAVVKMVCILFHIDLLEVLGGSPRRSL